MGVQPGKPTNDPVNYFAIGKQSAKGAVAASFYFLKHLDGSGFEVEKEVQRIREGGDGQEPGLTFVSFVKADGQMVAMCRPNIAARIYGGAIGAPAQASAVIASLARYTFTPQASLPYFTIEQRMSDEMERIHDAVMTGFTLEGEAGQPLKLTANFLSGASITQRDVGSALTVSRDSGRPHFYPGGSYVFDGGASYAADVTKFKIEVNRGVDDGVQTTGLGRDDVIPLNLDMTADCTIKYTSRDFYQKVTYNGGSNLIQDLPTGSLDLVNLQLVAINASTFATGMHRFVAPLLEWTDVKLNKLDPDGKTIYMDLVGMNRIGPTSSFFMQVDTAEITNPY